MLMFQKIESLVNSQESRLNVKMVDGIIASSQKAYIAIFKRDFDNSYIVWTSDAEFKGFYNGKYDMNLEQAKAELMKRYVKN